MRQQTEAEFSTLNIGLLIFRHFTTCTWTFRHLNCWNWYNVNKNKRLFL